MEALELPVLGRAGQAGEVGLVADRLEIAAVEEEGDGRGGAGRVGGRLGVEGGDGGVDLVQVAVAAALDGDLVVLMVAVVFFFFFFLSKKRLRRERKSLSKIFSCRRRPIAED